MEGPKKIAIYGAGGFAREVAWLLSTAKEYDAHDVIGYIEDGSEHGRILNGHQVLSWQSFMAYAQELEGALIAVAIGSPQGRRSVVAKCEAAGFSFPNLAHHSVQMSEYVQLGAGSIICCGSILTVNIKLDQHVHINLDCTIGHDVHIGEFTTLSPGVHISGNVHIGKDVYIGTGATVINGSSEEPLVIADGTVIGAGACITRSTEAGCLYAGVPAVLKKRYT